MLRHSCDSVGESGSEGDFDDKLMIWASVAGGEQVESESWRWGAGESKSESLEENGDKLTIGTSVAGREAVAVTVELCEFTFTENANVIMMKVRNLIVLLFKDAQIYERFKNEHTSHI